MTELETKNQDTDSEESEEEEMDSDEELQEAFAAGLLQPGLVRKAGQKDEKKVFANNIDGLKQKLSELEGPVKAFPWIERLDHVVLKAAPLAPELAFKEADHSKAKGKAAAAAAGDDVHNDFQREMKFYRQAQATVLEVLPRLQSMGVPTKRPEDYFAQMAKSDEHMQKIREKLVSKQVAEERLEKVKKLREMKKFGKKVQIEVQQKRQKEKKDMLDQVKKFRKGQADSIDFLNDMDDGGDGKPKKGGGGSAIERRKYKDKKYGFGGKKKGKKANTRDSVNDISSYNRPNKKGGFKGSTGAGGGGGFKGKGGGGGAAKRPGKSRRQNMKGGGGRKKK